MNYMYCIGNDKENIYFFSKESEAYLSLERIFEKISFNKFSHFQNLYSFNIDSVCEQKLILSEIKILLISSFDHQDFFLDDYLSYIDYLEEYKKTIAHLRDSKSKKIRALIKLYITIYRTMISLHIIEFKRYDPSGSDV
ncbi:hypothetical protein ACFO3O_09075 [Dokdonia ponticola]|uniref:Uncharacterized protein n=1 Tax=Dokdonia ponticola TaxID=2041041 RepID=A0ABV9HW02_9FLAO